MVFNFRKSIGNPINKTFSKKNVSTFFNKQLPDNVIKGGNIGGQILGSTGAGLAGIGYLTGQPELVVAGKGLGAGGAILKGSAGLTKGIQSARKY
jgi:hypothetical protein